MTYYKIYRKANNKYIATLQANQIELVKQYKADAKYIVKEYKTVSTKK
jgi:hypothetical protein